MTPFDFINGISNNNKIEYTNEYSPFLATRFFSFFIDTIFYAGESNEIRDPYFHYIYLVNSVKKKRRFTKWVKNEKILDIDLISSYYDVSEQKAKEYLKVLTSEQLQQIREYEKEKENRFC